MSMTFRSKRWDTPRNRILPRVAGLICMALAAGALRPGPAMGGQAPERLAECNVVWTTPSKHSGGSMPIGNGDIGLNVWVEEDGDLLFYVGKTDAWSGSGRLLKLTRVRIKLTPNPFVKGAPFRQELELRTAQIVIAAGEGAKAVKLAVWVDANYPVVRVEADSQTPFDVQASLEIWRTQARQLHGAEADSARGLGGKNASFPVIVEPDTVLPARDSRICWYHRNETSCYEVTLTNQHLGELLKKYPDPLMRRTFGGCILGDGLVARDDKTLASAAPRKRFVISLYALTAQTASAAGWVEQLDRLVAADKRDLESARDVHRRWWDEFWHRSWIFVGGADDARAVTLGYALQRWMNACGGRGAHPIKFNGSIFNVDATAGHKKGFDADYRTWGGNYWFQNTRLVYWPMPAAGDFDLMKPFWKMYLDALSLAKDRTRIYYKHDGAFFPETMYFWGTNNNEDFGWGNKSVTPRNGYIRYYWSGGLELTAMMLDCYACTGDDEFARITLLPLAQEITTFYDRHWKRSEEGKIVFDPAQSLETWHYATDPLPEIAGLKYVLPRLIALPEQLTTEAQRRTWAKTLADLPDIPMATRRDKTFLLPARTFSASENTEVPELYAVFPYRLYGVGKLNLQIALETWHRRRFKGTGCWRQDAIFAAYLGLAPDARNYVAKNFSAKDRGSRFPAFWEPVGDWLPDQDHGGVAMTALQRMLMQADDGKIILLPAWPKEWEADFKLHAPFSTIVQGKVRGGKIEDLQVTPASRRKDVVVMEAQ